MPGNIRELQNVIDRAVVLARGSVVQVDETALRSDDGSTVPPIIESLENNERQHIVRALNQTRWVIMARTEPLRF